MNLKELLKDFDADKKKTIDTPTLNISDNILYFKDYFLLISNISQVSIAPLKDAPYPRWAIILILLGFAAMSTELIIPGILAISIGGLFIYTTYKKNLNKSERLVIELNSGNIFSFVFEDRDFLNDVLEVLMDCANRGTSNATIDIQNSIITFGDQNYVEMSEVS